MAASLRCFPSSFADVDDDGQEEEQVVFKGSTLEGKPLGYLGSLSALGAPNFTLPHFNSAKQSLPVHSAVIAQAFRIRNPSLPSIMSILFNVDVAVKVVLQISSKGWGLLKSRKLAVASWSYSPLPLSSRGILKCWKQIARSLRQSVFSISKSHQNPIMFPGSYEP